VFKIVLTGATGVLGSAIIAKLRNENVRFVFIGRNKAKLDACAIAARPSESVILVADFADPTATADIFKRIERVDALVNVAGEQGPIGPFWSTDPLHWERAFRINFLAPATLCREAMPKFPATGGRIINVSGGGAAGPRPNLSAYACAKAALVRFSETIAAEVAPLGIDVNAIAPGAIASPMTQAILAAGPNASGESEFASAQKLIGSVSSNATRAADLVAYLLSPEAKGITGKFISAIWDDWSTLHQRWPLPDQDQFTLRRVAQ